MVIFPAGFNFSNEVFFTASHLRSVGYHGPGLILERIMPAVSHKKMVELCVQKTWGIPGQFFLLIQMKCSRYKRIGEILVGFVAGGAAPEIVPRKHRIVKK